MASSYLQRTQGTPTNSKKWTISFWMKANLTNGNFYAIFGCNYDNGDSYYGVGSGGQGRNEIGLLEYHTGATTYGQGFTDASLRDASAWYHIVFAYDSTQATASDRGKTYINGVFNNSTYSTNIPLNHDSKFNTSGVGIRIGNRSAGGGSANYDGSMASFYFIDGQQLTASSFGETDATTGIWKPKSYSGSYGTNGFFLKFENSGSLGLDSSGNGNNFTVNGTPTQTVDTPSNVFATMNPLCFNLSGYYPSNGTGQSLTNGNLTCAKASQSSYFSTMGVSKGKWYWEVKIDATNSMFGVISINPVGSGDFAYNDQTMNGYYPDADFLILNGVQQANGSGDFDNTPNVTYMFALDATNNKMWYGRNGTWIGNPSAGTSNTFTLPNGYTFAPIFHPCATTQNNNGYINFGNGYFATTAISSPYSDGAGLGKFQYQPPTGYYALCTKNINVYG